MNNQSVIKESTYKHLKDHIHDLNVDVVKGKVEGGKIYTDKNGYLLVSVKERVVRYHHIIGFHIFGERMVGKQLNHINGNKQDNRAINLEVVTPSENVKHAFDTGLKETPKGEDCRWSKLTENDVYEIRSLYKQGLTQKRISEKFNLSFQQISKIVRRERWGHLPEKDVDGITSLKFNEFQRMSYRTMPVETELNRKQIFANYALGLVCEAGETGDHIKKFVFHGHELDREKVFFELGDTLHYLSGLAKLSGYTLEEIAIGNIEKLNKRYKNGFSEEASVNRND